MPRTFWWVASVKSFMKRTHSIFVLWIFFAAGLITFWIDQASFIHAIESGPNVCPLNRYTGLKCAFCGMTHAWIYFWHGHFAGAFRENRLSLLLFLGTPILLLSLALSNFWTAKKLKSFVWISLAVLFAYAIFRNL